MDAKTVEEVEKSKQDEVKSENASKAEGEAAAEDEEEEEEAGECGFCLFMKGGGCKESFTAWEECIEEAEKNKEDVVEKCFEITSVLKECMTAHSDYYEPILKAEKAAEAEAVKELEKEKAAESSEQRNAAVSSENSEQHSGSSGKQDT